MPLFTVETTYHLPVYRQRVYDAPSAEAACRRALVDEVWGDGQEDVDSSGETYVTGIWEGGEANTGPAIPVPEGFGELVQRKADLFDTLLGLLREPAQPMGLSHYDFESWLPRALATIARAEAIAVDHEMQAERS